MTANLVNKGRYFIYNSPTFPDGLLKQGLMKFVQSPDENKSKYLQKNYSYGFDGYSYLGQEDSTNQYPTDLLHSFVISDFVPPHEFPIEFASFFAKEWDVLESKIRDIEKEMITYLNLPGLIAFYDSHIGHMISCNYYPAISKGEMPEKTRLSSHMDVSLFTIFPFGFDSDFTFETENGNWVEIPATNDIVIFPGYLLELLSDGKWKGLNHRVELPSDFTKERFSFAFFSLPYPKHQFPIGFQKYTSESYFQSYLDLF